MKFRELLEKYMAPKARKEWQLMSLGYMPLTPSLLKDFEIFIPKAYHITDYNGAYNVQKLQNKKIDLATFTKGSEGISNGAITTGTVLFELEGYSGFGADLDFTSVLDRNGRRWLDATQDRDMVVNNKFKVPIFKKIIKKYDLKDRFDIAPMVIEFDGKQKAEFIKFYYSEAKKLITKKLLDEIKKSIAVTMTGGGYDNNEILLHNYKINKTWLIIDIDSSDEEIMDDEKEMLWNNLMEYVDIDVDGYFQRHKIERIGK